jgi:hypothetical protein
MEARQVASMICVWQIDRHELACESGAASIDRAGAEL